MTTAEPGPISSVASPAARLRALLAQPGLVTMPCCFDALSARLIARAGFPVTFMSGFAVAATRLGLPDTGLISYGEMVAHGRNICSAVDIPVIGDADTGYGNAVNVKRTVNGYARAGFACAMIEDQVWPKRCGHVEGKQVVERDEAIERIAAAVDAKREGADILIMARTDARETHGLEEALARVRAFEQVGADIVFLEAPHDQDEMLAFCQATRLPALANMLEDGKSPLLDLNALERLGFKIVAFPLTLLNSAIGAMQRALDDLLQGRYPNDLIRFSELKHLVGFDEYAAEESRYRSR